MMHMRRFAGPLCREDAEVVMNVHPAGSFMVRDSTSRPGEFSISIKLPEHVAHIKIKHQEVCSVACPKPLTHVLIDV